jgi:hypothetical protein
MLYTILGAMIGGFSSSLLCRLFKISETRSYFPSDAEIFVFIGTLIGMGAGFGYGSSQLLAGTHIIQTLKS